MLAQNKKGCHYIAVGLRKGTMQHKKNCDEITKCIRTVLINLLSEEF